MMDPVISKLGEFWGPAGIVCGFLFVSTAYLYRRVEALQKENIDTLKSVLPLVEKFNTTQEITFRALAKKGGGE